MSLDCFPMQLQIIPYTGPPNPKLTSRCNTSKMRFNGQECLVLDEDLSIGLAPMSHEAGDVSSASTSEKTCQLEDFGSRCGDIGCTGVVSAPDEHGVEVGHSVSRRVSEEGPGVESSSRPALFKDNRPECVIVIGDDPPELDVDNDDVYCYDLNLSAQNHDGFGDANFLNKDHHNAEGMKDVLNSKLVDGPGSQDSGLRRRELSSAPSTPSTGSSIVAMEQQANDDVLSEKHVTMHEPQGPLNKGAEEHGKLAHLENTSRHSGDGSDDGTDDDTGNHRTSLTRKRQRSLPSKRHALDRRNCGIAPKICYSDDSSDSSSESNDRGRCFKSNKRRKSASPPRRSRSGGGADEEDEHEVEQILEGRVCRRKLQYRVKWLGYEDDPTWYDAYNFKNSPRKLREFHTANPTRPGPPKRLDVWLRCWDEDRDADDHPNDNKPQRPYAGREALRLPEPCGYSLRR